jgi:IS1 family transposase
VRVPENVFVLAFPVGIKSMFPHIDHWKQMPTLAVFVKFCVGDLFAIWRDDASTLENAERRPNEMMGQRVLSDYRTRRPANIVSRRLPSIFQINEGFYMPIFSEIQSGRCYTNICSQLFFGGIAGKIDGSLGGGRLDQSRYSNHKGDEREAAIEKKTSPDPFVRVFCGYGIFLAAFLACHMVIHFHDNRGARFWIFMGLCAGGMITGLGYSLWLQWLDLQQDTRSDNSQTLQHNSEIVLQKLLTHYNYWSTLNTSGVDMANVLNTDKQIAIIAALTEGSSIRSIERITGVHRDTIMRLGVKVGQGCTALMDEKMRDLPCTRLEMDEIWGFVGKKERHVKPEDDGVGSVWTFCAIDAETKLVPAFRVGDRDTATANAFLADVAKRMAYRVQISTDGLNAYVNAVENAFAGNADYGQIIKTYGGETSSENRRYSQPDFVSSEKKIIAGRPNMDLISTSYVERLNATTRLHMRRLTRLTLAFSKKRENFEAAVGLHFAYYNFVKRHNTLRCTPAMAAGVTGSFWSVGDLLEAAA